MWISHTPRHLSTPAFLAAAVILVSCGGRTPGEEEGQASPEGSPSKAGQFFVEKGCIECHSVRGLSLDGGALGPDLTTAYTDVPIRFGMALEEFMEHPVGTMQLVLSSKISLTEEERELVVEVLRKLDPATPSERGGGP